MSPAPSPASPSGPAPAPAAQPDNGSRAIRRARDIVMAGLTLGVVLFTFGVFVLVQQIFDNFGPAVQADLQWKAQRGAKELSRAADLALVIGDGDLVKKAFTDYVASDDVAFIQAVNAEGKVIAQHGALPPDAADPFAGPKGQARDGAAFVTSWSEAEIEGSVVGKIGIAISKRRISESEALGDDIRLTTGLAAGGALLLGLFLVVLATRLIAERDRKLADYAHNLEAKVAERTAQLDDRNRGMRLVLDNVEQGFVTIGRDGTMAPERSAIFDRWFGAPPADVTLQAFLRPIAPNYADEFELGLEDVRDAIMPIEVTLAQLKRRLTVGDRTLQIEWSPIMDPARPDEVKQLLMVTTDITAALARAEAEIEQRESMAVFHQINEDRSGVEGFVREMARIVIVLSKGGTSAEIDKRLVHTIKGSSSFMGLERLAKTCHALEDAMSERGGGLSDAERKHLGEVWSKVGATVRNLLGERGHILEIERADWLMAIDMVARGVPHPDLDRMLRGWELEPVSRRFEVLGRQARALAGRLGKAVEITIDAGGLRLDPDLWADLWTAMPHAVRNALDHGIEAAADRLANGKPEAGRLAFTAWLTGGRAHLAIEDDGRGIDWERVKAKARAAGLPAESQADLVTALFSDGFSTAEAASETSGRGVGLSALKDLVTERGGTIEVASEPGQGTRVTVSFPESEMRPRKAGMPRSRKTLRTVIVA